MVALPPEGEAEPTAALRCRSPSCGDRRGVSVWSRLRAALSGAVRVGAQSRGRDRCATPLGTTPCMSIVCGC